MLQFAQMGFPEIYERAVVGPLFRPFAEQLVAAAAVGPGQRVLDVACGTGIVARLAIDIIGPSGRVVAVDVNAGMLAVARASRPEVDWREGTAEALPVGEAEQFDVVMCQQGIQFFSDRGRAAAEMRRVLAPGGRIAVSTWRHDDENPFLGGLRRMAEEHLGSLNDQRHGFGDDSDLRELLTSAGFRDVDVQRVSRTVRFSDPNVFLFLNTMALTGMSAVAKDLSEQERQAVITTIVEASRGLVEQRSNENGLTYEIAANVATANRQVR